MRRELAVLLRVEPDNIWVRRMETMTGTHRTVGIAHIYGDPETALRVEPAHIIERNRPPEVPAEEA